MHSSEPRRPRIRRWARRLWPTMPGRPVRQIAAPPGPPLSAVTVNAGGEVWIFGGVRPARGLDRDTMARRAGIGVPPDARV